MPTTALAVRPDGPPPADADRLLVVLGGLPGSGKTTLLRRVLAEAPAAVLGLDAEDVTARLRAAGAGQPYGVLRPFVHAWHRLRVLAVVVGVVPTVVLTDPWTSPWWRALVLAVARGARRDVRTVLLDVPAAVAERGQLARGRVVPARSMRRHRRRWTRLLDGVGTDGPYGAHVTVVDRRRAAHVSLAALVPPTAP